MVRYEILILAVPEITADEMAALEGDFEKLISNHKGTVRSFDRWGKYRLAYPVRKNDYGVYFLARYDLNQDAAQDIPKEFKSLFTVKYPALVMRYMTTRLDPDAPLTYHKPESLEDIPSQDVDTFLRENKMEGLLKSSSQSPKQETVDNEKEEKVQEVNNDEQSDSEEPEIVAAASEE